MERRRALLRASANSKGSSIFPVSLIEGDNGEIGVKLFEYIIENADDEFGSYYFKDDEGVYVHGAVISYAIIVGDNMIALVSPQFAGNILTVYLFNTGVLTTVYD
jgi:hypothetical protein